MVNFAPIDLLDLRQAEGGAEEVALLHVPPPQPLAQLIQLLHAQRGQLTRERAALQRVGAAFTQSKEEQK